MVALSVKIRRYVIGLQCLKNLFMFLRFVCLKGRRLDVGQAQSTLCTGSLCKSPQESGLGRAQASSLELSPGLHRQSGRDPRMWALPDASEGAHQREASITCRTAAMGAWTILATSWMTRPNACSCISACFSLYSENHIKNHKMAWWALVIAPLALIPWRLPRICTAVEDLLSRPSSETELGRVLFLDQHCRN